MDLDLNLRPGRPGVPLTGHIVREVQPEDLPLLELPRSAPKLGLTKLRDSHHQAARLVAQGMGHVEVSYYTGYTPERVYQLCQDPAFQNLVEVHRKELRDANLEVTQRLGNLAVDVIQTLHERVLENPEEVTTSQLTEIAKTTLDRIGYGPQTKSTNVNVNVDMAGRLEAARRRAQLLGPLADDAPPGALSGDT